MLQRDVPDGRDVEEAGEQVWQLRGEDVEQGHAAVQPGQRGLTPEQLSAGKAGRGAERGPRLGRRPLWACVLCAESGTGVLNKKLC